MSIEEQIGQLPEHQPKSDKQIETAMPGEDMFGNEETIRRVKDELSEGDAATERTRILAQQSLEEFLKEVQGEVVAEMGLNADPNYTTPQINRNAQFLAG